MEVFSRRKLLFWAGAAPAMWATRAMWADPAPSEKRLLLDKRMTERAEGVSLRLGVPVKHPANPLFGQDRPWEPRFDNLYPNVLFEAKERVFKCWYNPFIVDEAVASTPRSQYAIVPYKVHKREMGVCYAISRDGIAWQKPDLGLAELKGSKRNNIVLRGPSGVGVFEDWHDLDPHRRYKMFYKGAYMAARHSPDGLTWSDETTFPEIHAVGDTHNNAFWSPELGQYVGITRLWDRQQNQRLVGRTHSADFLHWSRAQEVLRALPEELHRQTYAMPVFRYANVYLGLVMMFNTDRDTVDCELAWSPDTEHWERVCPGQALIPRGPAGSYDWGCIYAAAYPIVRDESLWLYYAGSNGKHTGWRDGFYCLALLRMDGFAGMESSRADRSGFLTTTPFVCAGGTLCVTADTAGGKIRASIVGAEKYGLELCRPITENTTDGVVRWEGAADLAELQGQKIQLRFELNRATLYSFVFAKSPLGYRPPVPAAYSPLITPRPVLQLGAVT
jgi:hypothetical protein